MYFHIIVACVLIMGTVQIVTLFKAILYARFLYPFLYKPRFLQGTTFPTVHLFVPCKGRSERLEQVIEAFATQDYPSSYRVTFVTESDEDGAVPLLREAAQRYSHLRHRVAGLAKTCGQKNHNLLVAMDDDHESEVFAFADADVLTESNWLRSLLQPLTLGPRYVTTGLPSGRISDNTYAQGIEAAYTTFQARYVMAITALWGGTFAIWRETLEKIDGTSTWSSTVVDDIALYERIEIFNQKASSQDQLLVYPMPDLPADIPTRMPSISNLVNWFTRQILFMRYHRRLVWQVAVLGNLIQATLIVMGPMLLLFGSSEVALRAGWICVFFYLYVVLTNIAQALIRRSSDFFNWTWIKGCMVGDLIAAVCLVRSVYARDLRWAGIRYTFDRRGHVAQVFHPSKTSADAAAVVSSSQATKH
ncbi:MAG: glycosyltransferase [Myxococcales bacterium]|nr:glycosyltransferase [Myxococcales bacterium]MCB9643982.1 glycosyltransferase [Myxococcales bacterium]